MTDIENLAKDVAKAMSDLNIFAGIQALMESSLTSTTCQRSESRIVKICLEEQQRCLKRYDKAMVKLENAAL